MPGIALDIMQHRLNDNSSHKPTIQKRRHLGGKEKCHEAEVKKLLEVGFIRKCQYPK